jgi:ketosteroid isomerase-like protein
MVIKNLWPGMLAICLVSGGIIVVPAIANTQTQSVILLAEQPSSQLNEDNIRQVLTNLEKAIAQEDVEGVLKFVAPFVYTEIMAESDGGTITKNLEGKNELQTLLKEIFARVRNSTVINQQTKIEITADGQVGIATISMIEKLTTEDGKPYFSSTTDTIRFAWLNNQPTIVSMKIDGWIAERPTQK